MRRLTRWLRPHNHEIRSVAQNAFQHRSGHSQRVRRWWTVRSDGVVLLTVRYGSRALELAKGKNAIVVNSINELPTVLKRLSEAVDNGEFDKLLEEQASYGKRVNTPKTYAISDTYNVRRLSGSVFSEC